MTCARPWWKIVGSAVMLALVLGLGLGCGADGAVGAISITAPSLGLTTLQVTTTGAETTARTEITTLAETTTVPESVDISAQLVGVWDCIDMPGDYIIEFRRDGSGETLQEGEIGEIATPFSYETQGYLVTLYYSDYMWQTLELSADGSVLAEEGPYGAYSFQRQ